MNLLAALNWRYATKRMNGNAIAPEKLNTILEATRLSPSSLGLQPYKIIVITDPETKKKIQPACYNQPQIVEGHAVVVFCTLKTIDAATVDAYIATIAATRNVTTESLEGFKNMCLGFVLNMDADQAQKWAMLQTYIALGNIMVAAALEEVDSTPMEGFVPEKLDEILELDKLGLQSSVVCVLGYRDVENDYLLNAKKVRKSTENLFIHI